MKPGKTNCPRSRNPKVKKSQKKKLEKAYDNLTEEKADAAKLLRDWAQKGYFVIEEAFSTPAEIAMLDRYREDVDGFWTTDKAIEGLQIRGKNKKKRCQNDT